MAPSSVTDITAAASCVTCLWTLWLEVGQGHSWITCVGALGCVYNGLCEGQWPQTHAHTDNLHTIVSCLNKWRSCVGVRRVHLCDPWTCSSDSRVLSLSWAPRRPVNVSAHLGCSASGEERGRHEAGVGSWLLFSSLLCKRLSVHCVSLVLAG